MKLRLCKKGIGFFLLMSAGVFFMFGCYGLQEWFPETVLDQQPSKLESGDHNHSAEHRKIKKLEKDKEAKRRKRAEKLEELDRLMPMATNTLVGLRIDQLNRRIDKLDRQIANINKEITRIRDEAQQACFPDHTKIMLADGSYKRIDAIQAGDAVMVYDIAKDTLADSTVKEVYVSDNNHYYMINKVIKATAYERFFTEDGFKRMWEISVGDKIFNGNSFEEVLAKKKVTTDLVVYNLHVNDSHNFFVSHDGQSSMLVHNHGGGGGGGGNGGEK